MSLDIQLTILKKIKTITKRVLLSKMAQTFDSLELLSPIIIIGKIIIKKLWHLNVDLDESVPSELYIYISWMDKL